MKILNSYNNDNTKESFENGFTLYFTGPIGRGN